MTEQTDEDDGQRPLTPDERRFVRLLRPILDDAEKMKSFRRLIEHEPEVNLVAKDYAAASWGVRFMWNVALFVTAITGGVFAWNIYKSGGGLK